MFTFALFKVTKTPRYIKLMDFSSLRTIRKRSRITLTDMAKRISVSKGYLSLIENNRKSPNIEVIENICNELDCELRIIPKT